MQHAQKLVLVPQEKLERLQRFNEQSSSLPSLQTPGDPSSRIDAAMYDVLKANIDDREKSLIYSQLLRNFLTQKGIINQQKLPKEVPDTQQSVLKVQQSALEAAPSPGVSSAEITRIAATLPSTLRSKGQNLLNHLTKDSQLAWNEKQEIIFQDKTYFGTNIVDLVNDTVRDRRTNPPRQRGTFVRILALLCTPREFIGNTIVKELVDSETQRELISSRVASPRTPSQPPPVNSPRVTRSATAARSRTDTALYDRNGRRIKPSEKRLRWSHL